MSDPAKNNHKKMESKEQEAKLQNLKNHIDEAIDRGGSHSDEEIAELLEPHK